MTISTAELEQRRLLQLNRLAAEAQKYFPGENGTCHYCGFRPRQSNALCVECETRRQMLEKRYPVIRAVASSPSPGFTDMASIATRDAWSQHNSE